MKSHFCLEELTFEDFSKVQKNLGKPPIKKSIPDKNGRIIKTKRFFKILNEITYNSIEDILSETNSTGTFPKCIWIPGSIPIGRARNLTLNKRENYFRLLIEKESKYDNVIVEISTKKDYLGEWYSSSFEYKKEDSVWTLKYFMINSPNFHLYTFEGIERLNHNLTYMIVAAHIN